VHRGPWFALLLAAACEASLDLGGDLRCDGGAVCDPARPRCVDLRTDLLNCGRCGRACSSAPNAAVTCRDGECALVCASGFDDCDGDPGTGCEVDVRGDTRRCGGCATPCAASNACTAGACRLTNHALGKPTTQSSTFSGGCARVSGVAVDGRWCGPTTQFGHELCPDERCAESSATLSEEAAWWEVDLGEVRAIQHVEVWVAMQTGPFDIRVLQDGGSWEERVVERASDVVPVRIAFPTMGRRVQIRLRGFGALWLREVVVAGGS
jgi:hypothetical protein